jgi:hypothetical protein
VLDKSFGAPRITKDGVTVAKEIELDDKFENMGAQMVKEVASRTNDEAGDGTTTATVLAQAIVTEGTKSVAAGMNPMDLKRGIDLAVKKVVSELTSASRPVSDSAEVAQVGTISANGEDSIGSQIADAMQKVGNEGVITVEENKLRQMPAALLLLASAHAAQANCCWCDADTPLTAQTILRNTGNKGTRRIYIPAFTTERTRSPCAQRPTSLLSRTSSTRPAAPSPMVRTPGGRHSTSATPPIRAPHSTCQSR